MWTLLQALCTFSESPILEEVIINEGNKMVSHGNIDFLVTGVTRVSFRILAEGAKSNQIKWNDGGGAKKLLTF